MAGRSKPRAPRRPWHTVHTHGATREEPRVTTAQWIARAILDSPATEAAVGLVARVMPPAKVHLMPYHVTIPRLPRHLDGLRVLHLSDLHLHPGSDLAWQVPELVAAVPHDLVCYTGDFIDCDDDIPSVAALLARMPRPRDAHAVLGNHDYIPFGRTHGANDVDRLRSVLREAGIVVLRNEARSLFGDALTIVGVDDPSTSRDDVARAFEDVPDGSCTLVLAHSPDVVLRLGAHQPDLVLAGHTHGGQIRLPRVGALLTLSDVPRHLAMGLGAYRGVPLFVSRGIGYSGVNMRVGTPAEVALLTLHAAPGAARPRHPDAGAAPAG